MRMNRYLPLCSAVIAAGTIFAATGAEGAAQVIPGVCSDAPTGTLPSCTCRSPSGFSIVLQSETPAPTQTTYNYKVIGQGNAKVNQIQQVQVVVSRPVSPSSQDAATKGVLLAPDVYLIRDYCTPDPNSGNNKGNCQGFLVHTHLASGATTTQGFINIPVGRNVADGMVTFNIIGGNGNTELCSAINDLGTVITPLSGIAGPGDIGDPFQPKFASQDATVADGKCIAHLIFDKKGNVIDLTTSDAPGYVPGVGETPCTAVSVTGDIIVNNAPLKNNTGPHGITFGNGTSTCYGPSIPSPAKCICTKSPCP